MTILWAISSEKILDLSIGSDSKLSISSTWSVSWSLHALLIYFINLATSELIYPHGWPLLHLVYYLLMLFSIWFWLNYSNLFLHSNSLGLIWSLGVGCCLILLSLSLECLTFDWLMSSWSSSSRLIGRLYFQIYLNFENSNLVDNCSVFWFFSIIPSPGTAWKAHFWHVFFHSQHQSFLYWVIFHHFDW